MLVLRELSPLLHVASILILVGLWTGFRKAPRAAALFVFLAALRRSYPTACGGTRMRRSRCSSF